MITLDENLASQMEETIRQETECEAAVGFTSSRHRKRAPDYGAAICGAQSIVTDAIPGGPLADFRLINAPQIPFTPGDIARAASIVATFARQHAAMLEVTPEFATTLGQVAFALAVDVVIDNIHLGSQNPVRHSTLSGEATLEPTQTTCSSTSKCEAGCAQIGMIEHCETSCKSITACGTDISTTTSGNGIATTTTESWTWPTVAPAQPTRTAEPSPKCAMDKPGIMQYDIFYGSEYNVVSGFCDEVGKDQESAAAWIVDSEGYKIPNKNKLISRSPPVTPDDYSTYKVELIWEPQEEFSSGSCPMSCLDAYKSIAQGPCELDETIEAFIPPFVCLALIN